MKARSGSLLLAIVTHTRPRINITGNLTRTSYSTLHRPALGLAATSSRSRSTAAAYDVNGNRNHGGIPIGAVQIGASHAQNFRELINSTLRTSKNRGVEKFIGPRRIDNNNRKKSLSSSSTLLIHVAPAVASALDDGHPELTEFLKRNDGLYIPGLRRSRMHHEATRKRRNANLPNYARAGDPATTATTAAAASVGGNIRNEPTFTFSELFAGIGGFRLGLEAIGGACVMANEIDPYAASIYRHNFGGGGNGNDDSSNSCHLIEADILDLCAEMDMPADTDILTAGFPCQPFSSRGKQRGLDDGRGQLYRELVRALRASNPKSFIFENVAGLVSLNGGRMNREVAGPVFRTMLTAFEECGYDVTWKICNSRHYVAQQRERVFIVGMRKDLGLERVFTWKWYEQMLLPGGGSIDNANARSLSVRNIMEPPHSPAVLESQLSPNQWAKLQEVHSNRYGGAKTFASIDIDTKAPTLISSYRRSGSHSSKFIFTERDGTAREIPRFLTPRECCRIQGFPEDFDIPSISHDGDESTAHFYAGIGNAVVPPVVSSIGKEIIACLRS